VKKFLDFISKSRLNLTNEGVKSYLLIQNVGVNSSRLAYASLSFFFREILNRPFSFEQIPIKKKEKQLPKVISKEKIKMMIDLTENLKHKLLIKLLYSSGYNKEEERSYSEVPKWEMETQTIKTKRMDENQLGREQVTQTISLINSEVSKRNSSGNLEQNYISTEKIDESQLGRGKNSLGKDYRIQ